MSGIISAGGGGANPLGDAVDVSEFEGITTGSYLRGKSDGTLEERTATQARSDLGAVAKAGDTMTGPLISDSAGSITADSNQNQANATQLTKSFNRITTCATENDAVKAPAAVPGAMVLIQNDGAETAQIFPQSGENFEGSAADAAITLEATKRVVLGCIVSGTWFVADPLTFALLADVNFSSLADLDVFQWDAATMRVINRSLLAAGLARTVTLIVTGPAETLTTGDGKVILRIPASINGRSLTQVAAALVGSASTSGAVTIQVRKVGVGDLLSTSLTIDQDETDSLTAATAAVIVSNGNEVMATGDLLAIDVDGAGTGAAGLVLDLIF